MLFHKWSTRFVVCISIFVAQQFGVSALKNVRILAADAVRAGESLLLICDYDLENAPLYSIKWYFKSFEFYRFVPKEAPPTKVFPVPGITVDMSKSDNKSVTITSVYRQLTGYYFCEISADAPSFHTAIEKMLIYVVEKPEIPPLLFVEKMKYSEGEIIKANCTVQRAFPAANLTWFVNDQKITDRHPKVVKPFKLSITGDAETLETSSSTLQLQATLDLFSKGKLLLACEATQFSLYTERVTQTLTEDVPKLAHVLSPGPTTRSCSYLIGSPRNKILHWLMFSVILCSWHSKSR